MKQHFENAIALIFALVFLVILGMLIAFGLSGMPVLELTISFINQFGLLAVLISSLVFNATILLPMPIDFIIFSLGALSNGGLFLNPLTIGLVAGLGAAIGELTAWAVGFETDKLLLKKRHGKVYRTT